MLVALSLVLPPSLGFVASPVARPASLVTSTPHLDMSMAKENAVAKNVAASVAAFAASLVLAQTANAKMPAELSALPESAEVAQVRQEAWKDNVARTNVGETGTELKIAIRDGALALKSIPPGLPIPTRIPESVGVTLPVLGSVRVDIAVKVKTGASAAEVASSDVVIALPKNLPAAAKLAAGGDASLSIDAPGLLKGRIDLDVNTPRNGEADVAVTSSLIPKLPLAKSAGTGRFCIDCGNGNEMSEWFVARNLNNGVSFYLNSKTGESQFNAPRGF